MAAKALASGFLMLAATSPAFAQSPPGDPAQGKAAFAARCGLCHSAGPGVGEAGQGPPLGGVVGRKAASAADFSYSAALRRSQLVWTPQTLDRFLAGPSKLVPGTAMPVAVSDAKVRADLIAYLATTRP